MEPKEQLKAIELRMAELKNEKARILCSEGKQMFSTRMAEFKKIRQELIERTKAELLSVVCTIMRNSDNVQSVSFTAYAPYFNDGDECVFSVNTDYLEVNGEDADEVDLSERDVDIVSDISEILGMVDDEVYREMIGNHVRATIYADGSIDVAGYDHD